MERPWKLHGRATTSVINEYGLRQASVFVGVPDRELATLDQLGTWTSVRAGKSLMRQEGLDRQFVLVLEGIASVHRDGVKIGAIGAGGFAGEIALLFDQPRTATVVSRTPLSALVLSEREFRHMVEVCPTLAQNIRALGSYRLNRLATAA